MKIHVAHLQVGDRLREDVFNQHGLPVLSANSVINKSDIDKLLHHQIDYVDIEFRNEHDYQEVSFNVQTKAITQQIQPLFDESVSGIKALFEQASEEGRIDQRLVQEYFEPLVDSFRKETDIVSLLLTLKSQDDYTYMHSVQVGMISYYLAKWLGKSEQEAVQIGNAGYLHDIGKSKVDRTILLKPDKLTPEEFEEVKKHSNYGYDIIRKSLQSSLEPLVALQHHERMNGKGYPFGLKEKDIHPVSKIIMVADIYSAMISSRTYQRRQDLLFVLKELYRMSFGELDPNVTQTFINRMLQSFIGKKVSFKHGETGEIVLINPTDGFSPLVKIESTFIDLSHHKDMQIEVIHM